MSVIAGHAHRPAPMPLHRGLPFVVAASVPGCHCGRTIGEDADTEAVTGTSAATEMLATTSTTTSEGSTGAPFDASRWIGRYHYEDVGLELGERGDPFGDHMLVNFEILADRTATMIYDHCAFEGPVTIAYGWTPSEPGWLELHPGEGESSLRLVAAEDLESVRIHLVEPCRELEFEIEGVVDEWFPFRPGESCWVDRCTFAGMLQVDYCPGEEPPPCP